MLDSLRSMDREILFWLNGLGSPDFDTFWVVFTQIYTWIPLYLLLFFLSYRRRPWRVALSLTLTMILSLVTTLLLTNWVKNSVRRLRPNNDPEVQELIRVLQEPVDFSFFSGHASFSFCLTTLAVLVLRKDYRWIYTLYVWPVLLAYSRIYVGVHFPGDVLVGALAGSALAVLVYLLVARRLQTGASAPYKP